MILVFAGGTCGDIVCGSIDDKDFVFDYNTTEIKFDKKREKLKKPHLFKSFKDKQTYLAKAVKKYNCIPSHDIDFHIRNRDNFWGITVEDPKHRLLAAKRFKLKNQPQSWKDIEKMSHSHTAEQYANTIYEMRKKIKRHAKFTIDFSEILSGRLINIIESQDIVISAEKENIYHFWLSNNRLKI